MAQIIFWSSLPNESSLAQRYMGPYQLSGWLEGKGITSQIIDFTIMSPSFGITPETLFKMTSKFIEEDTVAIGISTTFLINHYKNELPDSYISVIKQIRIRYPHIKFILGGNRAEQYTKDATSLFDAIVVGLAEDVLVELINYYKTGEAEPKFRRPLMHKTKFYYADDVVDKKFDIQTSKHHWREKDFVMPGESLPLELSRGCIFKCKFCQYPLLGRDKYDYTRSMSCVREELVSNYERWGTTHYYVLDDTFNDTVRKMEEFWSMTQSLPFKIKFATYVRADLLHRFPEMIKMTQEAGLVGAYFGIESLNPESSKAVGKAWSGKHAREFIPELYHNLWGGKVSIHTSMIVGLPGETMQSLHSTRDWLIENKIPSWHFKALGIMKYNNHQFSSEFSRQAEEYGYVHPHEDRPYYWINTKDEWDYKLANLVADMLNKVKSEPQVARNMRVDTWSIISLLSLGYTFDDLMTMPKNKLNRETLQRRRTEWVKAYRRRLLSWPSRDEQYWRPDWDNTFNNHTQLWLPDDQVDDSNTGTDI